MSAIKTFDLARMIESCSDGSVGTVVKSSTSVEGQEYHTHSVKTHAIHLSTDIRKESSIRLS